NSAGCEPQVQVLKLVIVVVVEYAGKQPGAQVVVVGPPGVDGLRRIGVLAADQGRSLDRIEVEFCGVRIGGACGIDSHGERESLRVARGPCEAQRGSAGPQLAPARML